MTALTGYQRLEASGLWRAGAEDQRRDVIVSLGDATLTISDTAERALVHWSLAAIELRGEAGPPAIYAPGPDSAEELEIEDETMVAAIEQVRRAVARRRPRRGRLRLAVAGASLLAILGLGVFWLPDALVRNAVSVVPASQRIDIGARLLSSMESFTGAPCTSRLGTQALAALQARLRGGRPGRIVVVRGGIDSAVHLPGGIIVLNRDLVERWEDPEVLAGFVLAEDLRAAARDPLARLLEDQGPVTAFRLLTSGDVPGNALRDHVDTLVTSAPSDLAPDALIAQFEAVGLPSSPFAGALPSDDPLATALTEGDPGRDPMAGQILPDDLWISLQAICFD
ncbi:hypothetical protein [Anianabacter salinae]|uniref:hypothetical protein n=1 Tax=Anianabacter salinae TaxID=2851023 RepID=UPI00225DF7AB|nr:hypothetical protein [Anianabacter salinae]MBV0911347.1 hypothetical protein [Anianabacter salinae]